MSPGRWAGPSAASKAVALALEHAQGLQIKACVLSSGGGAPTIYTDSTEKLFVKDDDETCKGLLLLIPVVLGVGKVSATSDIAMTMTGA